MDPYPSSYLPKNWESKNVKGGRLVLISGTTNTNMDMEMGGAVSGGGTMTLTMVLTDVQIMATNLY